MLENNMSAFKLGARMLFIAIVATALLSPAVALAAGHYPDSRPIDYFVMIALLLAAAAIYFLPTIVARERAHMSAGAVFVVNLFLGWTFLGWVGALAWAFTSNTRKNR
jgi:hypothetical protein